MDLRYSVNLIKTDRAQRYNKSAIPPGPPPARRPEPYGSESRPRWPLRLPARRASLQLGEAGGRIFSRGIVPPHRTTTGPTSDFHFLCPIFPTSAFRLPFPLPYLSYFRVPHSAFRIPTSIFPLDVSIRGVYFLYMPNIE